MTGEEDALVREAERAPDGGWESDGQPIFVLLRPLLPDERGCEKPSFVAKPA